VILHGNEEVALDDVWRVGKAISVKINGDKSIMLMCCLGGEEVVNMSQVS